MSIGCFPEMANPRIWLGGILFLAAAVRLAGIGHDLPESYYGDEITCVKRALSFGNGDLNPHRFAKPAFHMYMLFAEYGGYYVVGRVAGWWPTVGAFALHYVRDPSTFYLLGRLLSVAFGVGTVLGVYFLAARQFGQRAGLLAALFLALAYGHVDTSRIIKGDVPAAFFGTWSMFFLLEYIRSPRLPRLAWASALAGLGTATKYYPLLMLAPLVGIALVRGPELSLRWPSAWSRRLGAVLVALGAFWGSYFAASPYNFLDPRGLERTTQYFRLAESRGRGFLGMEVAAKPDDFIQQRAGFWAGTQDYVACSFSSTGMGFAMALVGWAGLAVLLVSKRLDNWTLASYGWLFAAASVVAFPGYAEPRHQCPLYPFLAIAGGALVAGVLSRCNRPAQLGVSLALVAGLIPSVLALTDQVLDLRKENTRNTARAWIEEHVPAQSKLIIDEFGPRLLLSPDCIDEQLPAAQQADPNGQFTAHYDVYLEFQKKAAQGATSYYIFEIRKPWWRNDVKIENVTSLDSSYDRDMGNPVRPVGVEDYSYYLEQGYEYAVVQRNRRDLFDRPPPPESERDAYDRFYADLFACGTLVKEFDPAALNQRGPVVRIYRLEPKPG